MSEINYSFLNPVKNRFLPLPRSAIEELEHEPNISDFNIIKEIGKGSYAKVYLATHKKTKAKYAIKAIDKLNMKNKNEKACFNREVEIMYKLDHPNIAKLYSHFEDNKYCYLLMQYIPNGNTYDLIKKDGKIKNLELIASIIKDILSALYYIHNMVPKIIHRDIKPENILLDENNNAYLIDFGWSNYIINNRRRNTICGTPIYYPPEMCNDIDHDERVDIWSIGVLLIELSTGKIPFKGKDIDTVKQNISELNISWPNNTEHDIKDLCSKILKGNPNQRPEIENILKHKFFQKNLGVDNIEQILIKPKKLKNKIFVVNKDVPSVNKEINNVTIENRTKRFNKTERQIKKIDNYNSYNKIKSNTDSKINSAVIRGKNAIQNINYVNSVKVDIRNKFNSTMNRVKKEKINNSSYNNNFCYHSNINSNEKNLTRMNRNINNERSNHTKLYSYSFINNNQTEENKANNDMFNYTINTHRQNNSYLFQKNWNSLSKNNYGKRLHKNQEENITKSSIDQDAKLKNKIIIKNNNLIERTKYQTYINNDIRKRKLINIPIPKNRKVNEKQMYNKIINRYGETLVITKKNI